MDKVLILNYEDNAGCLLCVVRCKLSYATSNDQLQTINKTLNKRLYLLMSLTTKTRKH
jgi:hypothetical protein